MKIIKASLLVIMLFCLMISCNSSNTENNTTMKKVTAKEILGNPEYQAISYGGYRQNSRSIQPTLEEVKEDMLLLAAMGIKVIRTYQTELALPHTTLKAISELKKVDPNFEMYMMVGAWIDCKGAWTPHPNHYDENEIENSAEIERAIKMAQDFPDIVKVIAVGNEAMVKWAQTYFVQANVILKWVNYLQDLKKKGKLDADLWITSSDNFASWGGGEDVYHTEDLNNLIKAVDYISMHTYPMHDTHYNPAFWGLKDEEAKLDTITQIDAAMKRALAYAQGQYNSTVNYMKSLGVDKPVHIGETGWASFSNGLYGDNGSKATDEYKEAVYHKLMRDWTNTNGISCFYFEAFDEPWKDANNPGGSENHFGLITVDGKAKYALWDLVDNGAFNGLKRGGNDIVKTFDGNKAALLDSVALPPFKSELVESN